MFFIFFLLTQLRGLPGHCSVSAAEIQVTLRATLPLPKHVGLQDVHFVPKTTRCVRGEHVPGFANGRSYPNRATAHSRGSQPDGQITFRLTESKVKPLIEKYSALQKS